MDKLGLFTIHYVGESEPPAILKTYLSRTKKDKGIPEDALVDLFARGILKYRWISAQDGDTYNPNIATLYGQFYPWSGGQHKCKAMRPLVVLDSTGKRLSEEEVREMVETWPDRKPMPKFFYACEDLSTFRNTPVPYTGNRRSTKFFFRSKDRSFFDDDLRTDRKEKSWKKNFHCRKAWMKHMSATDQTTIRHMLTEEDEFDEDTIHRMLMVEDDLDEEYENEFLTDI